MTATIIPFPRTGYVAQGGFAAPVHQVIQAKALNGMPVRIGDRVRVRSGQQWVSGVIAQIGKVMPSTGEQSYSVVNGLTTIVAVASRIEALS